MLSDLPVFLLDGVFICWVPESFTSPPDCHFHEGRDLLNDLPVSAGSDLASGNTS